jgi:hypothetical protein
LKIIEKLFSSFNFYGRILVSLITKGFKDVPKEDEVLADNHFYYSINRIYTKSKVKKMFFLKELPRMLDEGFLNDLKREVEEKSMQVNRTYGINSKCELVDIIVANPYELNFSTFRNRSRMMMWKRRYEEAIKQYGGNNVLDELVQKKDISDSKDRNRWMIESWLFVKKAKEEEKSSFAKTTIILELVADNDDILFECEKTLKDYMFRNEIKYSEVFLQSNEYNKAFSPAGNEQNNLLAKMTKSTILNDNIITSFDIPTHGNVGDDKGLYFGTDIYTGLPIFYDLRKGSDAKNILISANTGEGKSNFLKGLFSSVDILGMNSITLDYEGDEYTPIGNLYDASFIKVSGENSRYFNTISIGDLTGDPDIDPGLKKEAVGVTQRVFSLLLDEKNGMTFQETSIFSDCINRVYDKFGVTEDPLTWKFSKGCTYFHIYGELVEMSKEDYFVKEYGQHIKDVVIKLRTYFEFDGINRSMFNNPINLEELLGTRHIVFSFGMKGLDESLINTKELSLKQLFVGYITTLISNYNKSKGKLTAIYLEELQRYLMHAHSGSVVANMVSGGRKRGMILFLITNAPLQLFSSLNTDEELKKHVEAILGNINGLVLGRMKEKVSTTIAEYFNVEDTIPSLNLINEGGDMKYSFLINYNGESSIVKYLFHPDLLETPLYKTRKDQEEEDVDRMLLNHRNIKKTVKIISKENEIR